MFLCLYGYMQRITIVLTEEEFKRYKKLAIDLGMTFSLLIANALRSYEKSIAK